MDLSADCDPYDPDADAPRTRFGRGLSRLKFHMDVWWYLPCVGMLAGLDMFIWIVPTDLFLLTTATLRPRRWIATFLFFSVGSSLGMFAFAYSVELGGPLFAYLLQTLSLDHAAWLVAEGVVNRNAAWVLFLIAVNPLVLPQPAIAVAVIAGVKPATILWATLLGRLIKYGTYAFFSSRASRFFSRRMDR